jgi:STE24 endopeptidase
MQLVLILSLLAALAVGEQSPRMAAPDGGLKAFMALGAMLLPILAAWWVARATARQLRTCDSSDRSWVLRRFGRRKRLLGVLWLAAAGFVLALLDWPQVVRFNWGLDGWPIVDELLLLSPVLAPLVLSWAAFYDVERAWRGGESREAQPSRLAFVALHARGQLGLVLVPLGLLLATQDAARLIAPQFAEGPHGWLILTPPLAALLVFFPLFLRLVWRTAPLAPGPLRSRLEWAARRWGLHVREILVWDTGNTLVNAAVAGFVPGMRYVFLTDALLAHLSDEEVEAVFGHEVGHIRHHHVLLRTLVVLAPLGLWMLVRTLAGEHLARAANVLPGWAGGVTEQAALAALVGVGLYVGVVFGFCSRRLERQADLFGCRVASASIAGPPRPASAFGQPGICVSGIAVFVSALEKLAVLNGTSRKSRGWQHDCIAGRVAFLEGVARDPQGELRCHRQVRLLGSVALGIVVAGLLGPVLSALGWTAFF